MKLKIAILLLVMIFEVNVSSAGEELPDCGSIYAPPFADSMDAGRRPCPASTERRYTPKYTGLGYEILNIESDACFVPDESYKLLDEIVDEAKASISKFLPKKTKKLTPDIVKRISKSIDDVLTRRNFGLHIPTETLSDALHFRNTATQAPRHVIDCDTASLIYLTIADVMHLSASFVDITLPSGAGHNYVRWQLPNNKTVDWDTNGREICVTPKNLPSFQGKSMSINQVIGYAYGMQALTYEQTEKYKEAVESYYKSANLFPESPWAYNNLAWMISTKIFEGGKQLKDTALSNAKRAVNIHPTPNYKDTLACAFAFNGDFSSAIAVETDAISMDQNIEFSKRLELFKAGRDCMGVK